MNNRRNALAELEKIKKAIGKELPQTAQKKRNVTSRRLTKSTPILHSNANSEFIGFSDVAGMHGLKKILVRDVINPLRNPGKYRKFKVSIPNGILLYGPPGCGKTFIVKKLAEELGYHFIEVSPSCIGSTYIHGTSLNIAKIFTDAKNNKPAILFFDEFEGLVPKRESLGHGGQFKNEEINEFLTHLNNAGENQILVVCATNQIDLIDSAILRSGRIDKL